MAETTYSALDVHRPREAAAAWREAELPPETNRGTGQSIIFETVEWETVDQPYSKESVAGANRAIWGKPELEL
jgi:hypothetical protein